VWFNPKAMPIDGVTVRLKIKYVSLSLPAEILTLPVPTGGDFMTWQTENTQTILDGEVKKYVLKIIMKPGGGKILIDDVALLLG
jgi:hypothetical protein